MHAFVDESRRRGVYLVACVEIAASDVDIVRRRLRSWLLPGQRRLHCVDERNQRRQQLLAAFARWPIRAQVVVVPIAARSEAAARGIALGVILTELDPQVNRMIVESRQGRDHHDRRVIATALRSNNRVRPLHYEHRQPHEEPGLWLPDGIAWAAGAGGAWLRRLDPVAVTLTRVET